MHGMLLALVLLFPTSAPAPDPTAPPVERPDQEQRSRSIRLSITGAPADFEILLLEALKERGIEASEDERDGTMAVVIEPWSSGGLEGLAYELDLSRGGKRVGEVFNQVCVSCGVGDLARDVAGYIAEMAESLPPPPEPEPPATETRGPSPVEPPPKTPAPTKRKPWIPFLATGAPLLAAGSAIFGGGIGLYTRGEVVDPATVGREVIGVTDYRPPGLAMMISGGISIAAGAVLTGIGIYRLNRPARGKARRALSRLPRLALPGRLPWSWGAAR